MDNNLVGNPRVSFCLTTDRLGSTLKMEAGLFSDVPEGLLDVVHRFIDSELSHIAFVWYPNEESLAYRVVIDAGPEGEALPTATMSADLVQELPFEVTRRELDVITLVAAGFTNSEIALNLHISERTVTTHVDRLMRKLEAGTRTAVAAVALRDGLLRVPIPTPNPAVDVLHVAQVIHARATPEKAAVPRHVKKPLVVGAILPLTGMGGSDGTEMANASLLAIDEINARGGIGGRKLQLDIAPVDIMSAESIKLGMMDLLARDVTVITSGYLSHQEVAHEIVADAQVPYLHNATMRAMEDRVMGSPERFSKTFQVCPSDALYAPRFVSFITQLRDRGLWQPSSRTLAIVQSAWDLSDLGVAEAASLAEAHGWNLDMISVNLSSSSWAQVADRLRHTEPAAAMLGHYLVDGTISMIEAFMAEPCDTLLYSIYAPSVPEFRERIGSLAEGLLWATVAGTYSDEIAQTFALRYRQRFGIAPGRSHAGIAYDRIHLIAGAWSQLSNPHDSALFAQAMRRQAYRGVNGVYYFGGKANTALSYAGFDTDPSLAQAHLVFQIQDGQHKILGPDPYTEAAFIAPSWLTRTSRERLAS